MSSDACPDDRAGSATCTARTYASGAALVTRRDEGVAEVLGHERLVDLELDVRGVDRHRLAEDRHRLLLDPNLVRPSSISVSTRLRAIP
jgi:hypothetical protein